MRHGRHPLPAREEKAEDVRPRVRDKAWVLYLLRCGDGTLYTGITNDLPARLQRHAEGKGARYTRGRLPIELVHVEACADHSAALRREIAVKALPRSAKVALVGSPPTAPRRKKRA